MGKAQIISGGTNGLYTIRLLFDRTKATARITLLQADLVTISDRITGLETQIAAYELELYNAMHESPSRPWAELMGLRSEITKRQAQKASLVLVKEGMNKRIEVLQDPTKVPPDVNVSAYCADRTENLTGFVGTIEPNGEPGDYIIQPGHASNAVYNAARDGQVQALMASSPEATFFNKAMMPGWQKWKPTFRIGVIDSIDRPAHTCSVTLDAENSREVPRRLLDINQGTALSGVPIEYMT